MTHRLGRAVAAGLAAITLASTFTIARADEPAPAPGTFHEVDIWIDASEPDDQGEPVRLDAVVDIPDSGCPCPGILLNHGFLGNKGSERYVAHEAAKLGYVTLRYSSRGFGYTPGEVDLVGPKELQDALDAITWLNDPANPVLEGKVLHDSVGQYGGSYGGIHAWALAAAHHPALRTVAPAAAPTDLYQALVPNDVMLLAYANGFYASGFGPTGKIINEQEPPVLPPDLNYSENLHRWMVEINSGVNVADAKAGLDARSVARDWDAVDIPVFIIQGTNDGLFSQNQAVDAFQQLQQRGVPVRLYVGGIGHPPSNGSTTSPEAKHIGVELIAWFDHWLKGIDNGIDQAQPIEYSRATYFGNTWDGTTRDASAYPFGPSSQLHLCAPTGAGPGALSTEPCPGAAPALAVNTYAGQGYADEPVTAGFGRDELTKLPGGRPNLATRPGTLTFDGAVLHDEAVLDLAGMPALHLVVTSTAGLPAGGAQARGTAAAFQLDPKLWDVAPDGTASLITRGSFSERLEANAVNPSWSPVHTVSFDLFGLSYLVPSGHRLRLTLSTDDSPYLRPTPNPFTVAVLAGSTIDLPSAAGLAAS